MHLYLNIIRCNLKIKILTISFTPYRNAKKRSAVRSARPSSESACANSARRMRANDANRRSANARRKRRSDDNAKWNKRWRMKGS